MFVLDSRQQIYTVGDLRCFLQNFSDDTKVSVCGDNQSWAHWDEDADVIVLDYSDLDDMYSELAKDECVKEVSTRG